MNKKHKRAVICRKVTGCEYCKQKINTGVEYMQTKVVDRFGLYVIRRHVECDRTAELNEVGRSWF